MPSPISHELLAAQFEDAPFPFWIVDNRLVVLSVNRSAQELYPTNALADGIMLMLSHSYIDEIVSAIGDGACIVRHPSMIVPSGLSLCFTPWVSHDGKCGASAMLIPTPDRSEEDGDLRRHLEGVGNLVVTQGLRRCAGDIAAALSSAAGRLHAADIRIADHYLREINHSCYRLMRTAANLADTIHCNAHTRCIVDRVNFWDCCAELFEAAGTLLHTNGRQFSYTLPDSNLYVECDWDKLCTAILHVLSNSYLYGGDNVQVSVTGRDVGGRLMLTITDNGSGISQELQSKMFLPFSSWGSLDVGNAGTGLGLHLVRCTVTDAGGSVNVTSSDSGTIVAISLPVSEPPDSSHTLGSSSAGYLQDRYSPVYVALCDVVTPPELG